MALALVRAPLTASHHGGGHHGWIACVERFHSKTGSWRLRKDQSCSFTIIQTLRTNWGPTRTILIPSDSRSPKNPIHLYHSPPLNGSTTHHIAIQGTKPPTQEPLREKPRVVSDGNGFFIKGCPEVTWKWQLALR